MKKILSILSFVFLGISAALHAQDPRDTLVMYAKDSAVVPETEPTVLFFQNGEKIPESIWGKTLLISKTKKVSKLSQLLKNPDMMLSEHVLADLDNDGKKELVVNNFTGGAHCCDELLIYKNAGANKYQEAVRLYAGNVIITPDYEFSYSLHEHFGYFFTCYACSYSDTSDEAPLDVSRLSLLYKNGKMSVVQTDTEFKSIINDNLGKLSEQPYQKPGDDPIVDDGLRKEFALNLAAYYFTYGKNLAATQQLFNKYYKYPDAKKVWTAFSRILTAIRSANTF
ncbi:MAG: hypothetical protein NTW29_18940 [Bacteroidetes bacterium]|nr:hypothetical protein [Bacteroidota bacterium]